MIAQWVLLAVGLLLIAATALYVAAEFSLVTVDRATVNRQAADGDRKARSLQGALARLSTNLSGAQVGITATTLALGFVMEPSLATLLHGPLLAVGLNAETASAVGVVIALLVATVLSMVFGELVPKNIAITEPLATAKAISGPLRVSTAAVRPLIWVLNGLANGVLRIFGVQPQEELRAARTAEELGSLVRRSAARGTLAAPTAGLLARSIAFSGKTADDAMTPRVAVRFVKGSDGVDALIQAALTSGHSRFPVVGTDNDDVVGVVHVKRAVAVAPDDRQDVRVEQLMVPVPLIPDSLPLDDVLPLLRERGLQLAVVLDEYGGTAGILTLEDVVEELVGEITDEHDPLANRTERQGDGSWLVLGSLRPDEIAEATGIQLPSSGEYETVAGLLIARLGHIPEAGESVLVSAAVAASATLGALAGDVPIDAETGTDLPRAAMVRLSIRRRVRRRVETVQLSGAGLRSEELR